ncbi:MAG: hypothetical protein WA691_05040 [Thermoplasmata archaeon]
MAAVVPPNGPSVPLPPELPAATSRLPTLALWVVPFLLVLSYVALVDLFFHDQARWTDSRLVGITVLLLAITLAFSIAWFAAAYSAALVLGEFVTLGVLLLISRIPGLERHVVISPPTRPDSAREVWGRFGILLLVAIGFELIFMIVIVRRGELSPNLALDRPFVFFVDELVAGLLLAVLLAPAAGFLASRLRTRITDALEFPLLWLAALLLVVGGVSVLTVEVLPGAVFDPSLFLVSILFYAPAAWYVCLAFSRSEALVQANFVRRAWTARSRRFHFGRIRVTDEPEGTTSDV